MLLRGSTPFPAESTSVARDGQDDPRHHPTNMENWREGSDFFSFFFNRDDSMNETDNLH